QHVVNGSGGTAAAANFTMAVTGTSVSAPSFPGSETGTTVTLNAGAYQVDETTTGGYLKTLGTDCSGTIAVGESRTCVITNSDPAPTPFSPKFCTDPAVLAVMDPFHGRFPGNRGPDIVVDLRKDPLQTALDHATDVNGDGYIIVGVIGKGTTDPGGLGTQEVTITRTYDRPFALIGCSVTLRDPDSCDSIALIRIAAGAGSPEFPAGSGVTMYLQGIAVTGSGSAPGIVVEGDGRYLEAMTSTGNSRGFSVLG